MELLLILFSPAETFRGLSGRRWAWTLPAALMILFGVLTTFLLLQRFSVLAIVGRQIAQSGREMPAEGLGQATGIVTAIMYISPLVSIPLMLLAVAGVLLGIVKVFLGDATYSMMLNAAAYAMFAYSLVSAVLFLVMLYAAPDLESFGLENPIPLNAGYFVDARQAGKAWAALLQGVNLLNFYLIYLLALGAASLSNRVTTGGVLWPLAGIYGVYVLGKTALASLF